MALFIPGFVALILGIPLGYIVDKTDHKVKWITLGTMGLNFVGLAWAGPVALSPSYKQTMTHVTIATTFIVCGITLTALCELARAQRAGIKFFYSESDDSSGQYGSMKDDNQSNFVVSSLYTSSIYLGGFIGPTLAGIIVQKLGYPALMTITFGVHVIALAIFVAYEGKLSGT